MIPAKAQTVLDWITAHPGSTNSAIAAGTGMTRHMVSDRLQILSAHGAIHARHIVTDTGWKISLDRGLDIFQQYSMNDTFSLANRLSSASLKPRKL